MYFARSKPQNWRKRSGEARRRNCAALPKLFIGEIRGQPIFNRRDSHLQFVFKVCLLQHIADMEFDRPRVDAERLRRGGIGHPLHKTAQYAHFRLGKFAAFCRADLRDGRRVGEDMFSRERAADAQSRRVFAGYSPLMVVATTLVLGYFDAFQMNAQLLVNIPSEFLLTLPYVVTILALALFGSHRAP